MTQAAALQDDLRRADIEPWAWVITKSIGTGTTDPLLQAHLAGRTAGGCVGAGCAGCVWQGWIAI